MNPGTKRLYKSRSDRLVAGICGGLGEYFSIDANLVRVGFVILALWGGIGILLYLAALIVVPADPSFPTEPVIRRDHGRLAGMILIAIGGMILLDNFGYLNWFDFHLSWRLLVPLLFIVLGAWLLIDHRERIRRAEAGPGAGPPNEARILSRSISDKKILGVCGGFAAYFSVDSAIVRILWLLLLFASFGLAFIVYIALGILLPAEQWSPASQPGGES